MFDYTLDEWLQLLDASTTLEFASIQSLAAKHLLDLLDCFEKVAYGRMYAEERLYMPGYKELCERATFLTLEEGETLGLKDVIRIGQARERLSKGVRWDKVKEVFSDVCDELRMGDLTLEDWESHLSTKDEVDW